MNVPRASCVPHNIDNQSHTMPQRPSISIYHDDRDRCKMTRRDKIANGTMLIDDA
jgi:hypothetical protein